MTLSELRMGRDSRGVTHILGADGVSLCSFGTIEPATDSSAAYAELRSVTPAIASCSPCINIMERKRNPKPVTPPPNVEPDRVCPGCGSPSCRAMNCRDGSEVDIRLEGLSIASVELAMDAGEVVVSVTTGDGAKLEVHRVIEGGFVSNSTRRGTLVSERSYSGGVDDRYTCPICFMRGHGAAACKRVL